MIKLHKIAACCLIGTIVFAGKTAVAHAEEMPVAGIDLVLSDIYQGNNTEIDITKYLPSEYDDLAFAQVSRYVNIRSKAGEDGEILGKLYNNSAATMLEQQDDWTKVKSGSVTGYIKSEYLVTGNKAEELADTIGTKLAVVNTTTLKVRDKADLDSLVLTLVPIGEELTVLKEQDEWLKVSVGGNETGYVSTDYVDQTTEFEEAVSIEEEQQRLQAEEAAREDNVQTPSVQRSNNSGSSSNSGSGQPKSSSSPSNTVSTSSSNTSYSSLRSKIVSYALRFTGNPYVWGGTSLTNGADCSGFTQSVFRDNGISISRTSRTQAVGGRTVSISNLQPGDLVFYDRSGTINHVAIYIGNGQVISASSPETGIRVTGLYYRPPYKAVSYIN